MSDGFYGKIFPGSGYQNLLVRGQKGGLADKPVTDCCEALSIRIGTLGAMVKSSFVKRV